MYSNSNSLQYICFVLSEALINNYQSFLFLCYQKKWSFMCLCYDFNFARLKTHFVGNWDNKVYTYFHRSIFMVNHFFVLWEAYSKHLLFTILMRVGNYNHQAHIQLLVRLVLLLRTQKLDIRYDLDLMMAPGHAIK